MHANSQKLKPNTVKAGLNMERARITVEPRFCESRPCRGQDVFKCSTNLQSSFSFFPPQSVSMSVNHPSLSQVPITSCLCCKILHQRGYFLTQYFNTDP